MKQALWMLFGALLSVLGGFLTHLYQNWLNQKKEDKELSHKTEEILIDMEPIFDRLPASLEELIEPSKKLQYIARRIRTRPYFKLAEKLYEFSKVDSKKHL